MAWLLSATWTVFETKGGAGFGSCWGAERQGACLECWDPGAQVSPGGSVCLGTGLAPPGPPCLYQKSCLEGLSLKSWALIFFG